MLLKRILPFLLLGAAALQSLHFAAVTGQTTDETFYNGSAYPMLRYADYHYTGEHPPLIMHLGSLPLLFLQPNFPIHDPVRISPQGSEIDLSRTGAKFLYQMGNDPQMILFLERLPVVILFVITGFFLFLWSRRLFGFSGAVTSLVLYAFCPNLLAHGSLFTTDFGVTAFIFLASYALFNFLKKPTGFNAAVAGVLTGCALLSKVSALILVAAFLLIFSIVFIRSKSFCEDWPASLKFGKGFYGLCFFIAVMSLGSKVVMPLLGPLCLAGISAYPLAEPFLKWKKVLKTGVLAAGWIVCAVYAVRLFEKYESLIAVTITGWILFMLFISTAVVRQKLSPLKQTVLNSVIWILLIAAFTVALGYLDFFHSLTRLTPFDHYIRSLNIVLNHSRGGHTNCVEGSWVSCDWRYFPSVIAVKTSLVALFAAMLGAIVFVTGRKNDALSKIAVFTPPLIFLFVAVFLNRINIGLRHVLPLYPFFYLMAGKLGEYAVFNKSKICGRIAVFLLLFGGVFYAGQTLKASPHYLTYFSEWVGGVDSGVRLVSDSNLNWGQDNKRLVEVVKEHGINFIRIDSGKKNEDLYNHYGMNWEAVDTLHLRELETGFYALSIEVLQAHQQSDVSLFKGRTPYLEAGKTFLIYKIEEPNP